MIKKLSNRITEKGLQDTLNHACRVGAVKALSLPMRLKRQVYLRDALPKHVEKSQAEWQTASYNDFQTIRNATLEYIKSNQKPEVCIGTYSYKPKGPALLYATCYAALTRYLYADLDNLSVTERRDWIKHIQNYQCDDGLFRDPLINIPLAEDADWWGWRHLALHVIMALTVLGGIAQKEFRLLDIFRESGAMAQWLETRNWKLDPAGVSNEIQNYATLLQYARDFQNQAWCRDALEEMYVWLDRHQDPVTGLWGNSFDTPVLFSNGVQAGYHLWLLYLYDKRPIQYMERIIDSCLTTQNKLCGFGVPLNSSACEDIDSIDPLVRLYFMTDYRHNDIREALEKALYWVLVNINPDGGWVFRRGEKFCYGHKLMTANTNESAMFPTWFRTLSLAYLSKALLDSPVGNFGWKFVNCPGLQFWNLTTEEAL
jgi:hypothetical protein